MSIKLIVLPYVGANRYSFLPLKKLLSDGIDFFPVELPGRGSRMNEPLLMNLSDMADDILLRIEEEIKSPYIFFGKCMGALLSLLVTRKIRARQLKLPDHLYLTGYYRHQQQRLISADDIEREEFKQILVSMGTRAELLENEDFYMMVEPIMKADFNAFNQYDYHPASALDVPVSIILAEGESTVVVGPTWQNETNIPLNYHYITGHKDQEMSNLAEVFSREIINYNY